MRNHTLLTALCVAAVPAATISATPIFDDFGSFPNATFGGSGIPTDSVAASTQIIDGDTEITIALSATQRFNNPPLTNDGAGTYFATPGSNIPTGSSLEGARWNFNFYVEVRSLSGLNDPSISDYAFDLLYDFDAGVDTPFGSLGVIDFDLTAPTATISTFEDFSDGQIAQGSQNLLFGFLGASTPPFLTPPAGSFDPNELGEYTFAIFVEDAGGFGIESVAIDVVVPEPGTLALLGLGSLGLIRRTRR
ncbi:MAG: PEP-CTERM sorting domain-containing protein [Planctomycetota bacterium]